MTKLVESLISTLKPVAKELNEESSNTTTILSMFEKGLNDLNIGLQVWVPLIRSEDQTGAASVLLHLGYARWGDGWGLVYKMADNSPVKPLRHACRSVRASAVLCLPALTEKLKREIGYTLRHITESRCIDDR